MALYIDRGLYSVLSISAFDLYTYRVGNIMGTAPALQCPLGSTE